MELGYGYKYKYILEDKKEMRVSLEIEFRVSMKIMGLEKSWWFKLVGPERWSGFSVISLYH